MAGCFALAAVGAAQPAFTQTLATASVTPERDLLDRYCVTCHNEQLETAGLRLDATDVTNVAANPAVWEKVVRKLRAGAMPPVPRPRPDDATYARFIAWLETELDQAAAVDPAHLDASMLRTVPSGGRSGMLPVTLSHVVPPSWLTCTSPSLDPAQ